MNRDECSTLPPPDVTNFRDFGGLETPSGVTRRDRLFRSGHVDAATPQTLELLAKFDFELIADLRYERERSGHRVPWTPQQLCNLLTPLGNPDGEAPHLRLLKSAALDEATIAHFYKEFYASVPFDAAFSPVFAEFLQRLASVDRRVLIHCSIGKDRTGILAALVNSSLGVGADAVMQDYLASRDARGLLDMVPAVTSILQTQLGHPASPEVAAKLLSVDADYLDSTFAAIRSRCGSVEKYLDALGCDAAHRTRLRQRFVVN